MAYEIQNLLTNLLPNEHKWKINLLAQWHSIVGTIATTITLEKIYDDMLIIGVTDSSWLQELYMLSAVLLQTINANLDQPRIKRLRFKLVSPHKKKKKDSQLTKEIIPPKNVSLTDQQLKVLTKVKDKELAKELKKLLLKCQQESV